MYSTGAAAAYTSDSFVVDTDPYLFESIQASSFSLRSTASTYSVSALAASDPVSSIPLNSTLPVLSVVPTCIFYGTDTSSTVWHSSEHVTPSFNPFKVMSSGNLVSSATITKPDDPDYNWHTLIYPNSQFSLIYDVSPLSSSCIQLNGTLQLNTNLYWGKWYYSQGYDLDVYIDGDLQKSYYTKDSVLDFGGFVYDSPTPVQEVIFIVKNTGAIEANINGSSATSGSVNVNISNSSTATIDGLSDDDVLKGFNDNAQDAMNQQDALESQWTGSMTENFNNLSLSDFAFPVAAVNGFSLISGIFNDLWNAMGDFRIVYVFPLTLGVVLLLIGRLSRTSVKRSSGRGDEDV